MSRVKRTLTRDLANGDRVVVHLELREAVEGSRFDERGISPGFAATCDVYEKRRNASGASRHRRGLEPDGGGADHKTILHAFPNLRSFVALHLSDPDGVPMHGVANGWYWYCGWLTDIELPRYCGINGDIYAHQLAERGLPDTDEGRREYCLRVACEILRVDNITLDVAPRRRREPASAWGGPWDESQADYTARVKDAFIAFVEAQRERWAHEATEGRKLLESL